MLNQPNNQHNSSRPSRRRALVLGFAAAVAFAAAALAGCGGGGGGGNGSGNGGGGSPVTVTGRVLRSETGVAPSPAATVTIGGKSVTTGADGTFSFSPPSSATTATITATGTMSRTITIKLSATTTNNLGDIFLSDTGYTANVNGRVVALVSGVTTPVGGATVTIGNVSGTTATDGTFTLMGLPLDLGNVTGVVGKVSATGFEDKPITDANLQFPLVAGANPIGDLLIAAPSGSTPLPPFTISGVVKVGTAVQSGVSVQIMLSGASNSLGTATTDSTGTYTFWVVPGAYTVTATNGASMQSANVTLVRPDQPVAAPTITF